MNVLALTIHVRWVMCLSLSVRLSDSVSSVVTCLYGSHSEYLFTDFMAKPVSIIHIQIPTVGDDCRSNLFTPARKGAHCIKNTKIRAAS